MGNQVSGSAYNVLSAEGFSNEQLGFSFNFNTIRCLSSTRFLKTNLVEHREGHLVVKIFIKPDSTHNYDNVIKQLREIRELLSHSHNVVPCPLTFQTEKVVCTARQYVADNLYDRMSTRPFLSLIEKKWISYQILCSLKECHSNKVCHGDIKTENVLVTSWNWILLGDFASYKPTYLPVDNPASFSLFFDTSRRRSCYIAPERFYDPASDSDSKRGMRSEFSQLDEFREGRLAPAMDIFSAGCVIAELFNDGRPIFDLSQLLLYRTGEYNPSKTLEKIEDADVRELVEKMINVDCSKRLSAQDYLLEYRGTAFPSEFYDLLYPFLKPFASSKGPDATIERLRRDFSYLLNGLSDTSKSLGVDYLEGLSYKTGRFNAVDENETIHGDKGGGSLEDISGEDGDVAITKDMGMGEDGTGRYGLGAGNSMGGLHECNSMLVIISLITHCVRSLELSSSKLASLSLLLECAKHVSDVFVIDRVIPYVIAMLSDQLGIVRSAALRTLTQVLKLIKYVPRSDANIFPEYILPSVAYFVADDDVLTRVTYAENIASLAETGLQFLENSSLRNSDNTDFDDSVSSSALPYHGSYDTEKVALQEMVQEQVVKILCDPESIVKQTILADITRLCIFFGRQKTNEVLLGHIITYLNDRDWRLKCSFYESIVGVSTYVGGRSLESYILPLLTKGLTDMEEFVVEKALQSLTGLAELGLFQKKTLRSLSKSIAPMLCHPGNWIRFGAVNFFTTVAKLFSLTDLQCILLPILRPFLKYPISDFRNDIVLLESLKSPLSRQIYDRVVSELGIERFFDVLLKRQLVRNTQGEQGGKTSGTGGLLAGLSSGPEEGTRSLFEGLWKMGMNDEEEDKIIAMEDYLSNMSCRQNIPSNEEEDDDGWKVQDYKESNINLSSMNVKVYSAELSSGDQISDFVRIEKNGFGKYGGMAYEFEDLRISANDAHGDQGVGDNSYSLSFARSSSSTDPLQDKTNIYTDDQNCKDELQQLIAKKQVEAYPPPPLSNLGIIPNGGLESPKKGNSPRDIGHWQPQGINVAHLNEHNGAITRLAVAEDSLFFVSGSNDGTVKVWDAGRLESNVSNRSRHTYSRHGGKITALTLCENSYSIASASDNGSVHVYRVEHTAKPNTSSGLPKYGGFCNILQHNVDLEEDGCVLDIAHFNQGMPSVLSFATVRGSIYGFDLRSNKEIWKLSSNPVQGLIRSYTVDKSRSWMCVGTSEGVLSIWDIRFQLPVKTWVYPGM